MDRQQLKRYQRLVTELQIPDNRREPTATNFRWQLANAWIANRHHPKLYDLLNLVRPYA